MKPGISLIDLARKIEANREMKHDLIADTLAVEMIVDDEKVPQLSIQGQAAPFGILPTAHDQIAGRLEIPVKYYQRMRAEAPALLAENANHWFRNAPAKRMIRTLGGDVRALLSNRYQRIENEEIAEVALPALQAIPDVKIVSAEITDRRMYIQAVAPRTRREVKVGDVVEAGVIISNSEIGLGSVSVLPMIRRLACLNGMVIADRKFVARHVGRQIDDNEALWAEDTRRADDRAVLLKVRDMVAAAVNDVMFAETVNRMSAVTELRVTGDPAAAVEVLAKKIGATDAERGGILRSLIEGGDLTGWGLLNAVTHQAHTAKDYDRSVEFERAGGAVLNLSRSEWREVLEAA